MREVPLPHDSSLVRRGWIPHLVLSYHLVSETNHRKQKSENRTLNQQTDGDCPDFLPNEMNPHLIVNISFHRSVVLRALGQETSPASASTSSPKAPSCKEKSSANTHPTGLPQRGVTERSMSMDWLPSKSRVVPLTPPTSTNTSNSGYHASKSLATTGK